MLGLLIWLKLSDVERSTRKTDSNLESNMLFVFLVGLFVLCLLAWPIVLLILAPKSTLSYVINLTFISIVLFSLLISWTLYVIVGIAVGSFVLLRCMTIIEEH